MKFASPRFILRTLVSFLVILTIFLGGFFYTQAQTPPSDLALEFVSLPGDTAVVYRNDGAAIPGQQYFISFQWVDASGAGLAPKQTLTRSSIASRGRETLGWNNTMVEGIVMRYEQRCYTTGGWFSRRTRCDNISVPYNASQALAAYRAARPRPEALLAVMLDDGNRIAESNEGNNSARVGNIPFQGAPSPPVAELVITRATFDGINLFVVFQNQSSANIVNQPFDVGLQWLDQNGRPTGDKRFIRYKNLVAGRVEVIDSKTDITTLSQIGPGPNDVNVAESLSAYLARRPVSAMKLQITVDDRNQILEMTKTNNLAVINLPPLLLPDLAITKQVQIFNPQQLVFSYANLGQAPLLGSPTFSFWFEWLDGKGARLGNHLYWQDKDVRLLPPSASTVFVSGGAQVLSSLGAFPLDKVLQSPPPEAVSLKITIDGPNAFREVSEENNTLVFPKPVRPFPDLLFGPITPAGNILRVEVQNKGVVPSPPPDVLTQWFGSAGPVSGLNPIFATAPIMPGSSYVFNLALNGPSAAEQLMTNPPPTATRFQLTVDGTRRIMELNEENNTATVERSVLPVLLPDLIILKQPQILNQQQLVFNYVNQSRAPLTQFPTLSFWFEWVDATGARVGDLYWHDRPVSYAPPGGTVTFTSAGVYVSSSRGMFPLNSLLQSPPALATHLKITIDGPNKFRETDENNNTALLLKPAMPDLSFGAISGREGVLKIEVKNQGTALAEPTDIWLQWWSASESLGGNVAAQIPAPIAPQAAYIASLAVNGKTPAEWLISHPAPGATQLRLTVDGIRRVTESNEENNTATVERSTIPVVLPELSLTLSPQVMHAQAGQNNEALVGDQVRLNMVAKNTGIVPASEVTLFLPCPEGASWVSTTANGASQSRQAGEGLAMPDLAAGSAHGLSVICKIEAAAVGKGSLRFVGSAQIKEGERKFNSNTVEVAVSALPEALKLDFSIEGIELVPKEEIVKGANLPFEAEFSAVIQNNSEIIAPATRARLRIDAGDNGTWDTIAPAFFNLAPLEPDELNVAQWNINWRAPLGSYAFEVCVDMDNKIAESDETNNCLKERFTLQAGEAPIFEEEMPD